MIRPRARSPNLIVWRSDDLSPVLNEMWICISAHAEPDILVEVLKNHEIVPASVKAEILKLCIVHAHSAAVNHTVLKGKDRVIEIHLIVDSLHK